jgi:hypothetical protein
MCDYSLHAVASRPARVGDKLITTQFENTVTAGFSAVDEPKVAVCLLPGTELAFEADVYRRYGWLQSLFVGKDKWNTGQKVGRFCQIDLDKPHTHHDAVEFPNGEIILLTSLRVGQRATVLQLPVVANSTSNQTMPDRAARHLVGR